MAGLVAALWLPTPSLAVCRIQEPSEAPQERPVADAEPPAEAEAATPNLVKGWLQARPGRNTENLPEGIRVIEPYGGRIFVELPAEAVSAVERRGLSFHPVPDADILSVGSHRFDVRNGKPSIEPRWLAAPPRADGRRPYVIKFDAPVKPEWLEEVRSAGAEIVQYQPHFGYLLLVNPGIESRLQRVPQVGFTGEYHPAFKASRSLLARAARDETITLRVVYFDLPGYEERVDDLLARGARLGHLSEGGSTSQWALLHYAIFENVRTRDLPAILREPHVYWAERWFPPEPEGERAAQITAGNISGGEPIADYSSWLGGLGTEGAGVTVAVADTGLDTGLTSPIHEDFAGRVSFATALCTVNRDRDGHGTNVAAIALGDPRLPTGTGLTDSGGFYWGMGSAPGAFLHFQKALDPGDCGDTYNADANTLAQDAVTNGGAHIGTHSFTDGLGDGNTYGSQAQAWDARVRDADTGAAGNQPYAVFFSAGNSGPAPGSLTSPKAAKNIVTVGATENYHPGQCPGVAGCGGEGDDIDALVGFSSRGPTSDGRIKPDVSAPGHVIAGALSSAATYDCYCDDGGDGCCASLDVDGANKYSVYSGTSQASPRAAGAAALVFGWYNDNFGSYPSPAMNKAILINGATDMKTPDTPNFDEGWGRVNLRGSLQAPLPVIHVDQSTIIGSTGDPGAFTMTYYAQDPTSPSKATLVWTDAPAAVGCNPCLVNDLDLLVTQGSSTWLGNSFTNGFSDTGTTPDSLNNVEGTHLPGGTFTCDPIEVKVRAQSLNGDGVPGNGDATDQDFALVVSNAGATAGPPLLDVPASTLSGGCDDDEFLDRRETADLTLDLHNAGCSVASGVEATLSVESQPAGANVTVSPPGPQLIGTIGPGLAVPRGWEISLDDYASSFCGKKVTLRIDFTDGGSGAWTDFVEVNLDGDGFTPVTLTDPADTDNSFSKDLDWSLQSCRVASAPTSWHMGETDCSGIPKDGTTRDLIFAYTLSSADVIREISFQHAFTGYRNTDYSYTDMVQVDIDPEDDGSFVTLQSWRQGIDNPLTMTLAGPYDLAPFNATRGDTIKIRFRFTSAANWAGPNQAAGWDVDDIIFKYDEIACDPDSCACAGPSGLTNNTAADLLYCQHTGVEVNWAQDAGDWADGGSGVRTYTILRDGTPLLSGGCGGPLAYGTTSCVDGTTAADQGYNYQVRYVNGCSGEAETTGASAVDAVLAPPPVNDGTSGGNPVTITFSGGNITMTWDTQICALQYNVYMGSIGTYWSHAIFSAPGLDGADSCFEPSNTITIADPGGSVYFLVAAQNELLESNLGASTVQDPRPYADPACSPH